MEIRNWIGNPETGKKIEIQAPFHLFDGFHIDSVGSIDIRGWTEQQDWRSFVPEASEELAVPVIGKSCSVSPAQRLRLVICTYI